MILYCSLLFNDVNTFFVLLLLTITCLLFISFTVLLNCIKLKLKKKCFAFFISFYKLMLSIKLLLQNTFNLKNVWLNTKFKCDFSLLLNFAGKSYFWDTLFLNLYYMDHNIFFLDNMLKGIFDVGLIFRLNLVVKR